MLLGMGNDKIIIGYDLADTCSQISYCYIKEGSEVATLSSVAGEENYDIPTILCKKCGTNQWLIGNEAYRFLEENPEQGILVDNLLQLAIDGETLQLEGTEYEPENLLALFVKRSLNLLTGIAPLEKVTALMFTCDTLSPRMIEVLNIVSEGLALKKTQIFYQNYTESFYSYMIYQPKELWDFKSLLFDYRNGDLKYMCMECNKRTSPVVVYIDRQQSTFDGSDGQMLEIAREALGNDRVSSVYLIGEKFAEGWMKQSLKFLCDGRRVFQGNNLYSKGACFCLIERLQRSENGRTHVFLGKDKLKANIGMQVKKRGEDAYYALLDAGVNWYELEYSCELYLQGEDLLEFVVTPLIGRESKLLQMPLEGLGLAEEQATRIKMKLRLTQENRLLVKVEDLGFGEFRAPSERNWEKEMELY